MLIFTIKMFIMLYFITKKIKRKVCFSIILNLFRTNKKYPDTPKMYQGILLISAAVCFCRRPYLM